MAEYLAGGGTIKLLAALDFSACNAGKSQAECMHRAGMDRSASTCQQIVCAFAAALQVGLVAPQHSSVGATQRT